MISAFRRYLETWVVRGFFLIMVLAFVTWGVGDVVRLVGHPTWVAKVAGQTIEGQQLQDEFQRGMAQLTRSLPAGQEPSPAVRSTVADEALQRLVAQAALDAELQRLHIVAPGQVVRQTVFAMPAFRGPSRQFDQQTFQAVLRNNGLTEQHFLELVRVDLAQQQLLGAVTAGTAAPKVLLEPLFQSRFEQRAADMVEFPVAAAPAPSAATQAELQRWYDNHPDSYSAAEYRKIKAIILSPQTLAKDIPITDADLRAAYEQRKAQYVQPEKRSAEVVSVQDEAKANQLATTWRGGANWAAMQTAARAAGGSAVALDDAAEREFPEVELSKAVFGATSDTVTGPIKSGLGWHVLLVTKVSPGSDRSFEQVKDELRSQVLASKAADLMYDRANKIDNILGTGASLDQMPNDLGLAGVTGTLDAQGNTQNGTPAPIPGPPELREALIKAAFATPKGDPPRLIEVQTPSDGGSAYYALSVEDTIAPAVKPFDAVKEQVAADWTRSAERHTEEQAAAKLLTAVKQGQSLADAAAVAGVTVRRTPLVTRDATADGLPPQLQQALFGLKQGEPTMVETNDGFVVAVLADIVEADPRADPAGYAQVRAALARSMSTDISAVFSDALRARAEPRINQAVLNSITGQQQ